MAESLLKTAFFNLLLLLATSSQAEIIKQSPFGFVLENRADTRADTTRSWQALTQEVDRWWPAEHTWFGDSQNLTVQPRAGGCFCEIDGDQQVEHMRIAQALPGQLLRMMGGLGPLQGMGLSGPLDWIFEKQENGGTRIRLRYHVSGYSAEPLGDFISVVDRVQAQQLKALAAYLDAQTQK